LEPDYQFHKEDCLINSTPFIKPKDFLKKGLSKSKSQKYQCKTCKKHTNVLPTKKRNTGYHQQRNEILPLFAKLLVNKTSINRACEILDIGKGTYYQKLEHLYLNCLDFLETRETKQLNKMSFDEMWLNTDKLHYVLNNVLKKGQGKNSSKHLIEKQLLTHIVTTADVETKYVFRSDIAYDWDKSLDCIETDTNEYKEDHLNSFQRKNDRFGSYSAHPMLPTTNDTQTYNEFRDELQKTEQRKLYVDGLHVNSGYTAKAHLWLIKNSLNVKKWRFITDNDDSLINSFARVFMNEIQSKDAHHMICVTDKTLTRNQAKKIFH
jgi:transposase-like protein